jgi:FtsH-binding integral membrane protein
MRKNMISIWFFIGTLLLIYGVLIFGAGIYEWVANKPPNVVHAELHAAVWWGALLLILGGIYTAKFRPRKEK